VVRQSEESPFAGSHHPLTSGSDRIEVFSGSELRRIHINAGHNLPSRSDFASRSLH